MCTTRTRMHVYTTRVYYLTQGNMNSLHSKMTIIQVYFKLIETYLYMMNSCLHWSVLVYKMCIFLSFTLSGGEREWSYFSSTCLWQWNSLYCDELYIYKPLERILSQTNITCAVTYLSVFNLMLFSYMYFIFYMYIVV